MRPREGHDLHIARASVSIVPTATVRWLRDTYDNSIAIVSFEDRSDKLNISSEVDVDLYYDNPVECLIEPFARSFPSISSMKCRSWPAPCRSIAKMIPTSAA